MKPGSWTHQRSPGGRRLVDERACFVRFRRTRSAARCLDPFPTSRSRRRPPLYDLPNVIVTDGRIQRHGRAGGCSNRKRQSFFFCDNLRRYAHGEELPTSWTPPPATDIGAAHSRYSFAEGQIAIATALRSRHVRTVFTRLLGGETPARPRERQARASVALELHVGVVKGPD